MMPLSKEILKLYEQLDAAETEEERIRIDELVDEQLKKEREQEEMEGKNSSIMF